MTNIDYSKIVIYKIVCKDSNVKDVYVGSTTRFNQRRIEHKIRCTNEKYKEYNFKVYQIIRANGGWDNWNMEEIIKQPCKDSAEAHALERYYYELLFCNMNTNVPNRSLEEYKKKYNENYREINKDKINEYRQINKEKMKQYQIEYRQQQRERKSELQKINHIKYKQDKILNYESNETRNETLKQILNI
jgi:hypothetical protein